MFGRENEEKFNEHLTRQRRLRVKWYVINITVATAIFFFFLPAIKSW